MRNKLLVLFVIIISWVGTIKAESIDLLDSTITVNESSVFGNSKTLFQYNNKGTLIRRIGIYASWSKWKVGVPMIMNRKSVVVYDDEGHEIDLYYSSLDTATGKWTDDHRYLYDEWHNRTYSVGKWNADSTALLSGVRYFYDSNHFLVGNESFDTWNGIEIVTDKYFYTNDGNGYKIAMYGQFRPDSAYAGDYKSNPDKFNQSGWKYVDSAYYERNAAGQSLRETFFRWDESNNKWLKDGYQDFTYDAQGHMLTDTVFARDFETNIITYNNMTVREYDSYGNLTRTTTYSPVFSEGPVQWQVNDVSVNEYTYNDKGLIVLKRSYTDYNNGEQPQYATTTYYYSHYDLDENGTIVTEPEMCIVASGTCGENLTWKLSCDSVLTISGTGAMTNYQTLSPAPWWYKRYAIKTVIVNEGVTTLGTNAFSDCKFTSVSLPNTLTSIPLSSFSNCKELISIVIPESVISIGAYAFAGCNSLTTITIPKGVKDIDLQCALSGSNMIAIYVAEDNPNYRSIDGALYSKDSTALIQYPYGKHGDCVLPDRLERIGYLALSSELITSITCGALVPPALDKGAIDYVNKSIPLYVHYASIDAYKSANGWKDFTNIQPIEGFPVVFLNYNGEVLSEQYVKYGMSATAPNVPDREGYTFVGWSADIEHIVAKTYVIALYEKIGGNVTYLSEDGDVIATENVDLHLPAAPIIDGKSFNGWLTESADSKNGIVFRATYTMDNPTTHDDVNITPFSNSAAVIFPFITGALTYQLVIRDLFGNVVCKIMFNAAGYLLGVAFAPSGNRAQQQATQSSGFNFTVEGLDANTTYEYEFVANDETDAVIETLSGSFTTAAEIPTGNEIVKRQSSSNSKFIESGHLFINNNDRIYDARGQEVK